MQTSKLSVKEDRGRVTVSCEYWKVQHQARLGGCWTDIRFRHGSGKNLLAGPVTSFIRTNTILGYHDMESPIFPSYQEHLDAKASLSVEQTDQSVIVIAQGRYRDDKGQEIGVGFRHRYEYKPWGLIESDLEIVPDRPVEGVIMVSALEMQLRAGMTHAHVTQHPAVNPNVDLRGGGLWLDLPMKGRNFWRYVPLHVVCFEKGVEGLDLFPPSDLASWDTGLTADEGLGYYTVAGGGENPTAVVMSPYCIGFRRVPITLDGPHHFRVNASLPYVKPADSVGVPYFHVGADSRWPSDEALDAVAAAGIKLVRFHNDFREDGPYWHDGQYPPYDAAGMAQLRRIIDTCHRLDMKIVPYMSLKEFHPQAPGYAEHAEEWTQAAAPHVRDIHTWIGTGEYGRLLCMESPWLKRRMDDVDRILSDLPWDGLYYDWVSPLPCCHQGHMPGRYHTDTDGFLAFLNFSRARVGEQGVLFLHLSGHTFITAENMSDVTFIYEDVGGYFPTPDNYPPQCRFVPIAPRYLATGAAGGTVDARRLIMGSLLQGHPPAPAAVPGSDKFSAELLEEMALFAGEDLSAFRLSMASDHPVQTGSDKVYGAIWRGKNKAMVYLGNFSDKKVRGSVKFDAGFAPTKAAAKKIAAKKSKPAAGCQILRVGAAVKQTDLSAQQIAKQGLPYTLGPWKSMLVKI